MLNNFILRSCRVVLLTSLIFSLNLVLTSFELQSVIGIGSCCRIAVAYAQDDAQISAFILLTSTPDDEPGSNVEQLSSIQEFIGANGGRITHTFPYQAIIAKIPSGLEQQLATLPGVAMVRTQPLELSTVDSYGPDARRLASVWNTIVAPAPVAPDMNLTAAGNPTEYEDALIAPDLPSTDKLGVTSVSSVTPGYYQTSEFMTGSVAVGIVLVESDGSVDSSTEDWTYDEKQLVFSEIVAGLNWWAELEPRAKLSFVYDDHFSNPLPTGVEPITRPYYDQRYWIKDAMGALGYTASSYFTRVRDYNNNLRTSYQTDWAFTIFVVDSSADTDNYFSNGYFAYAYLGGPFMVMTYGNNGYGPHNMDAVTAHEVGHIFNALDQYYSARQSCTRRSGYLYVENQNSQYGSCSMNVNSIMRGLIYPYTAGAVDPYAAGQVGWRDSDGDDILDPLDTDLPLSIDTLIQTGNVVTVSGTAEIIPYPSPTHTSVTINTLTGVQYRFNGGPWQQAVSADGIFDGTIEQYSFTANSLPSGFHTLEVAAVDSAGNVSDVFATETVIVFDGLDPGPNTVLFTPQGDLASQSVTINGLAYHFPGRIVANVEYRVNGGPWQAVSAQDGAFDSDYELFSILLDFSEAGTYLIEAYAIDADGHVEANLAHEEIEIGNSQQSTVFLPLVIR